MRYCAGLIGLLILSTGVEAKGTPLAFGCYYQKVFISPYYGGFGAQDPGPNQVQGCSGPLTVHWGMDSSGEHLAELSLEGSTIDQTHTYTAPLGFSGDYAYFYSAATVSFSPDLPQVRIVPTLIAEQAPIPSYIPAWLAPPGSWSALLEIWDRDTGEQLFSFFSGTVYDLQFADDPPIDEMILDLVPGRNYLLRSQLQTSLSNTWVGETHHFSVALFAVPEPTTAALVALGMLGIAARRATSLRVRWRDWERG